MITNTHAMKRLKETSRTFYIPISRMAPVIKEAVASAYLCMRAIDEIEDHPTLPSQTKAELLLAIGQTLRTTDSIQGLRSMLSSYQAALPKVSVELPDWLQMCPDAAKPIVSRYVAKMSEQMAGWVQTEWKIQTEEDLDSYTYSVAGMVGEMLSELWLWFDDTKSDMAKAVAFGRGLQAVNIIRNRNEDLSRGVDFFPTGWGKEEMIRYTQKNLQLADAYLADLKQGPALDFCKIPLALAHATIRVIAIGGVKLTRANVNDIVGSL
jgi:farnesyl-diphosphate farnesyltransferase